jgi:hypothetical protein
MVGISKIAMVVPLLAVSAIAGRAAETADVPLRFIGGDAAVSALRGTPGLDGFTFHPQGWSVSLTGTADALVDAKSRLALADVPVAQMPIKASFVRYERDAAGHVTERTVLSPLLSTLNEMPIDISSTGAGIGDLPPGVTLTPSIHRDGTVTLSADVQQPTVNGRKLPAMRVERRLSRDKPIRLLGITSSDNTPLRLAIENGEMPTNLGPYTAMYLDVTVYRAMEVANK